MSAECRHKFHKLCGYHVDRGDWTCDCYCHCVCGADDLPAFDHHRDCPHAERAEP